MIARELSAELEAQVTVEATSDGERGERARVSERIEVASRFKHAELIRPVEGCELCEGARCVSWVVLSRDDAARRLIEDAAEHTRRFREATLDLKPETPLPRFVQAWRRAREAHQALTPTLHQLSRLERTSRSLIGVAEELKRASAARADRAARLAVKLEPLELSRGDRGDALSLDALPRAVESRLGHALATLKLKRSSEVFSCSTRRSEMGEGAPEVIRLTPRGELICKLGFIGPQCELTLSVKLEGCVSGHPASLTEANWSDLKLIGAHPRSAQVALTKLDVALSQRDLSERLKRTISPFVLF